MSSTSPSRLTRLRCEYLHCPHGIDETAPRLSWNLETDRPGACQVAYQIRVASSAEKLAAGDADLWDSGKVNSNRTQQVAYAGEQLSSRDRCHWSVEVWDETGESVVSDFHYWTIGLLAQEDWSAKWLAANPDIYPNDGEATPGDRLISSSVANFRKQFVLNSEVRRATLYASARGLFEFSIDRNRVGEDYFSPEWTDYNQRIQYRSYDVTTLLSKGDNVISALLGDGWWSGYVGWQETRGRYGLQNSLIAQLEVELTSGEVVTISTDDSWVCNTGPVLSSDFMMGEVYDARREHQGLEQADFDSSGWLPALVIPGPDFRLNWQASEPVQIIETLRPVSIRKVGEERHLFDLGQNISGWVKITVKAPRGTVITIRHGERLDENGMLYTENLRRATSVDTYICSGEGQESWQPHFTFHGFQYFEICGLQSEPDSDTAVGCVLHSALPFAGQFDCSNADVNRLWLNGLWSQRDNFLTVPTDCPQRDERLGWTGDAEVFMRTASYNMDIAAFFTKWMTDIIDAQTDEGIFPDTAPRLPEAENFVGLDQLGGGAGWADAGVIVPHTLWRIYGDERIVERSWNAITAWLEYLERTNPDYLRVNELANNYGDWLCIPSDTSFRTHSPMKNLLATAFWADDAAKVTEMARALGKSGDAQRFGQMFERVKAAFQKEFLVGDGRLTVENQTAYLLCLAMNLVPEDQRARAAERLVDDIRSLDWHLSTGFIGIRFLNPILSEFGYNEVAYKLLLQDDYPSWLYPVKHGATTIWERWNGWTEQDGFFNPHMNSFNHYSLGSIGEWFFRYVAGIDLADQENGFGHFVLKPFPDPRLGHAGARYQSVHGEIISDWKYNGNRLFWSVTVPANTTASAHIPMADGSRRVVELAAGKHTFENNLNDA